uniref:Uncharacterized protein n=2 Tax=Nothobranchius korthausae TaxID=1143690 RepID=A0A1A8FF20_9TELE
MLLQLGLSIRMKRKLIFSRRVEVNFRRGPTGYPRQDPSDEAKKIKNPDFQDRSPALREDKVKENAHSIVLLRGGDVTDKQEVLGEYLAQFGKYKGKSFRWILENDVGYVVYLTHKVEEEERAGQINPDGLKKESCLSFLEYSSFTEIVHLLEYISKRLAEPDHAVGIDDTLVGFGVHSKKTWREIWENRADGYVTFILQKNCVPGSKMFKLKQYLQASRSNVLSSFRDGS